MKENGIKGNQHPKKSWNAELVIQDINKDKDIKDITRKLC